MNCWRSFYARSALLTMGISLAIGFACAAVGLAAEVEQEQQTLNEAVALLDAELPALALEKLQTLLNSKESYVQGAAQYYSGRCLLRQDQQERAADFWLSISEPTPRQHQGAYWYYSARLELAKFALAGEVFTLKEEERQPAAIKRWEEILNARPYAAVQAEAAIELGAMAKTRKQDQAAIEYYQFGLDSLDAIGTNPEVPNLTENKGELVAQLQKQLDMLEKSAQAAKKEVPKAAAVKAAKPIKIGNVEAGLKQAKELGAKEKLEPAIETLQAVLAAQPEQAERDEARFYLGRFLLSAGQKAQAVQTWDGLLQDDPAGVYCPQILLDMADQELFQEFHLPRTKVWLKRFEQTLGLVVKEAESAAESPAAEEKPPSKEEPAVVVKAEVIAKRDKNLDDLEADKEADKEVELELITSGLPKKTFDLLPVDWQHAYLAFVHRQAVVSWLEDEKLYAALLLELSLTFNPHKKAEHFQDSNVFAGESVTPTLGIFRGGKIGDSRQEIPVTEDRPEVATALRLGELAMAIRKYAVGQTYFDAVGKERSSFRPTPEQEGYALLRAGLCSHWLKDRETVRRYFTDITTRRRLVNTLAIARAYKREASLSYSIDKNPERAIALMRVVYTQYPDTNEAIDAFFFSGVFYEWEGNFDKAVETYLAAFKEYPDHRGMQTALKNRFLEMGLPLPKELEKKLRERDK